MANPGVFSPTVSVIEFAANMALREFNRDRKMIAIHGTAQSFGFVTRQPSRSRQVKHVTHQAMGE
jgi:hypothetical protein